MSEYKNAQIIAAEYKTGVEDGEEGFVPNEWAPAPTIPNDIPDMSRYLISKAMKLLKENLKKYKVKASLEVTDMEKRLKYFAFVSGKIISNSAYKKADTSVLKCMLWPEFYWCPEDEGAYSMAEYRALKATLRALLQNKLFKDSLIVNGTIVWKMDEDEQRSNNWKGDGTNKTYFNCSLISYNGTEKMTHQSLKLEGAEEKKHNNSFIIQKAYMSTIDGVPGIEYLTGTVTEPVISANNFTYYQAKRAENKHVFTIGSLKIGLDICLEHIIELLSKAIINVFNDGDVTKSTNVLDIQLLTACGMPMEKDSLFLTTQGVFGRVDGGVPESSNAYRTLPEEHHPSSINNIPEIEVVREGVDDIAKIYPSLPLPAH